MSATVTRIDRSIRAHDEDLDQAILDMTPAVIRLATKESIVLELRRQEQWEGARTPQAEANAIRDTISLRARRLNVSAFGLRLIIEQHESFRRKTGRRPNMEQLTRAVEAAEEVLRSVWNTDEVAAGDARAVADASAIRTRGAANASAYLRASA